MMVYKIKKLIDKGVASQVGPLFYAELEDGGYIDLYFDTFPLEYYKIFLGGAERVKLEFVK